MADLPRLAVTREQTHSLMEWRHPDARHTLRLPERPTMWSIPQPGDKGGGTITPIPEGTRVEVGWWELKRNRICGADEMWHPVATATLAEVHDGIKTCLVTLTDVEEHR